MSTTTKDQRAFLGSEGTDGAAKNAAERLDGLPLPPPWRAFSKERRPEAFSPDERLIKIVNAALVLRRPILLEGNPGSGKTSLAYAVARELGLPGPFRWSITSRSTLGEGLYLYDALGRLNDYQMNLSKDKTPPIGRYLRLGPVGMAFAITKERKPAVLLIDEIDKSDIDLPSDLLHLFEEGRFPIPELERLESQEAIPVMPCLSSGNDEYSLGGEQAAKPVDVIAGQVRCEGEFPLVIMTSNRGREFPAPFLRRCLRAEAQPLTTYPQLLEAACAHLKEYAPDLLKSDESVKHLIEAFQKRSEQQVQSFDQLLNALVLALRQGVDLTQEGHKDLLEAVWASLGTQQALPSPVK